MLSGKSPLDHPQHHQRQLFVVQIAVELAVAADVVDKHGMVPELRQVVSPGWWESLAVAHPAEVVRAPAEVRDWSEGTGHPAVSSTCLWASRCCSVVAVCLEARLDHFSLLLGPEGLAKVALAVAVVGMRCKPDPGQAVGFGQEDKTACCR